MKKQFIFILGLCIFSLGIISAQEAVNYTYSSDYNGIQITELRYEPYPVNPGEYFDIWIKANTGGSSRDTTFELAPKFPFSLDENENPIRKFGNVNTVVVFNYKVRVSDDAVEGVNELDLKYNTDGNNNSWVMKSFDIPIANAQTDFDLVIQESSGTDVSLAIANIGKNTANSLIIRIPEQNSFAISGTNGQMVGNLNSGDYTIVSFGLTPIGRSDTGTLKVQLDYTDSIGKRRSLIKDVQFISSSPIRNATMQRYGNVSGNAIPRGNFANQQASGSIFKNAWFWLIIIIILGTGYYTYRNPERAKDILSKLKRDKSGNEKSSKGTPEWVSVERTKKK